ncbi:MAG: site-specific DNA-methyltransferase [Acidobacteria bacterium]|nr:site-specific DNA-methyltransferase [Acidobacteriota bacterium]MXZ70983.1 site-specific DNA-methyltransferase [Acidobacteriota bacterium]MYD69535.1 site-specific DNA-methyltransferase [Acidobacteriota bacterium]MYJ03220.1 site-specific DNA-methyltransferase [Acidobacteriota bacterium]
MQYAFASDADQRLTLTEFVRELEGWRRYGKATTVSEYAGVPVIANEFWTSRQRAAHSLHEISYRACFKPQLPRFFITRLTNPDDVVFDPFMGRGTTLLEAALHGRQPLGNDVNPLSRLLLEPRLDPPSIEAVVDRLSALSLDDPAAPPDGFDVFFHERTLNQICRLREYLRERRAGGSTDAVDRWIQMVAINRLTGHSPGFFSVYTLPPNQATTIERQRKTNARRNQRPEYRDVADLIRRKTRSLLRDVPRQAPAERNGGFFEQPVGEPFAYDGPPVTLAVTSPPFLDVVNYRSDNWMRCWFAGVDPEEVEITQTGNLEAWRSLVRETLENVASMASHDSVFAFEVGEVRSGSLLLDRVVVDVARDTPWEPVCVVVNEQAFTKTSNTWGVRNNRAGTNSNRIVVMRRG